MPLTSARKCSRLPAVDENQPIEGKKKIGRPKESPRDKVDYDQAERMASMGLTDKEMGYVLGVSESTIHKWKRDDPAFLEVLKKGKLKADLNVTTSLYKRATGSTSTEIYSELVKTIMPATRKGDPDLVREEMKVVKRVEKTIVPDTMACMYWLNNRRPAQFKFRQDPKAGDEKEPLLGITDGELQDRVKELLKKANGHVVLSTDS